tara:strand:- start:4872 stop:5876 length:1005 start_codon:yes stop_codon:yes gene_type:complete
MPRIKKKLKELLFLATIILICFAIAEGTLRLVDFANEQELTFEGGSLHIESENEKLYYTLNPNTTLEKDGVVYLVNEDGYRDDVYDKNNEEDNFRIIAIGDSITFGSSVEEEDRYTEYLERNLGEGYEVINFGISGYSPTNEMEFLQEIGLEYNPDLIIVGYALNDAVARESEVGESFENCKINLLNLPINCELKEFLSESVLLQKTRAIFANDEAQQNIYIEYHNDEERWEYLEEQYDILKEISKEENIPVIVIIFPILSDLENYEWLEVHKKVGDMLEEDNFIVIDAYDLFLDYEDIGLRATKEDPWHPNALGHQLTAEALYEKLINEKLLE